MKQLKFSAAEAMWLLRDWITHNVGRTCVCSKCESLRSKLQSPFPEMARPLPQGDAKP